MDHAGGIGLAVKEMKNARVFAHRRAYKHLVDPSVLWEASQAALGSLALKYGKIEPVPADRIIIAEDGMKLDLGKGLILKFITHPVMPRITLRSSIEKIVFYWPVIWRALI